MYELMALFMFNYKEFDTIWVISIKFSMFSFRQDPCPVIAIHIFILFLETTKSFDLIVAEFIRCSCLKKNTFQIQDSFEF